jgi:hypothetical protein
VCHLAGIAVRVFYSFLSTLLLFLVKQGEDHQLLSENLDTKTASKTVSLPSPMTGSTIATSSNKMEMYHNALGLILVSTSPYSAAASMRPSTTAVSSETEIQQQLLLEFSMPSSRVATIPILITTSSSMPASIPRRRRKRTGSAAEMEVSGYYARSVRLLIAVSSRDSFVIR